MKKKTLIAVGASVLVAAGLLAYFLTPRPVIADPDKFVVSRVTKVSADGSETDITAKLDIEELKQALASARRAGYKTSFAPYAMADVDYEIDGVYDGGTPVHILIGHVNVVYGSADGGYRLQDGAGLAAVIEAML